MAPDQDSVVQFDRVTDSGRILQDLLGLSHQGLVQPIQFFPDSSYEYAEHLLKKAAPEKAALNIGRRKWIGSEFANHAQGELVLSIIATIYYKNTAFTWWERLPAANIAVASCCRRLSRLEAAPTKVDNPVKPKKNVSVAIILQS